MPGRLRRLWRTLSLPFCTTNRYDRDVGLAESGYYHLVPPGHSIGQLNRFSTTWTSSLPSLPSVKSRFLLSLCPL